MPPARATVLRRRRLREAVIDDHPPEQPEDDPSPRAIEGTVVDASPHLLVLNAPDGAEVRLPMTARAAIWYEGRAGLAALRPGRNVIVRPADAGGLTADRIWVDITRVSGIITDRRGGEIEVDGGPHRGPVKVTIPRHAMSVVQVRHPRLEPGALIDVIGVHSDDGGIKGLLPATRSSPQPASHADDPRPPRQTRTVPTVLRGTATWYDAPAGMRGAAYPAVDRHGDAGGCGTGPASPLPYLSIASELWVHNDCTGRAARIPITECGCLAARFCDRCVRCGTSPRGRIVELTRAAFVDLGGDLDVGCFNVSAQVDH
jgi:hypothetical protein